MFVTHARVKDRHYIVIWSLGVFSLFVILYTRLYTLAYNDTHISVLSDSSIKDLGIAFQDTLTFDEHISKITST